jgi:hypothetical protein
MNNLYFACIECKIYIDAGYRWAYWQLEQAGIVDRGEKVSVKAVLAEKDYWNPPEDQNSLWLYQGVFPPLREFLQKHDGHRIVFGEESDFLPPDHEFDWMQVGYMLMPTPRYLVEVLGLKSWDEVVAYMQKQTAPPAWWEVTWEGNPSPHKKGKEKFEELIKGNESMGPQL